MKSYKTNSVTKDELIKWKNNPLENPRTSKEISITGQVYKYLKKEYDKIFSFNILDSIDDKDPISMTLFWKIEKEEKVIVYEDINNLILYKDDKHLVRCFEKNSLEYLKAYKIDKHPVTGDNIPKHILDSIKEHDLTEDIISTVDKAFNLFQKFSKISIFIDSETFTSLEKTKLIKFNYELRDFYINNFSMKQKNEISSTELFKYKENDLQSFSKDKILDYLIDQMNVLLDIEKEEYKYMANYIMIGALGIVIPQIKDMYPDFSFSF